MSTGRSVWIKAPAYWTLAPGALCLNQGANQFSSGRPTWNRSALFLPDITWAPCLVQGASQSSFKASWLDQGRLFDDYGEASLILKPFPFTSSLQIRVSSPKTSPESTISSASGGRRCSDSCDGRRFEAPDAARHPLPSPLPLPRRPPPPAAASRLAPSASRHRPGFALRTTKLIHTRASAREALGELAGSPADFRVSSPWPEWSKLVNNLVAGGYSSRRASSEDEDSFLSYEGLSEAFVKASEAFLSFARDRPDLLRLLSKKDIEVIVENRSPFLFKNGGGSSRRMRLFLSGGEIDVLESERAQTVDLVRYLLCYTCNRLHTLDMSNMKATERTEASVQNLLNELINFSAPVRESNFNESTSGQLPMGHEQLARPRGQNIEMKRGDWICLKCSFMNFARNARCLECNEGRPKRQLTGGEWECPQCDFFNYGRNMSCLRCDCKRPGESATSGFSGSQILNGSNTDKSEIERRLAANDEKAERWFSKVSQLDDSADLSRAAADEDFPEIMPLRKGVNRFVVSTRKTPLERRLAEAQYRNNSVDGNDSESRGSSETTAESSISQSLDRILGRSGTNNQAAAGETNTGGGSRFNLSNLRQSAANQKSDPNYVPFVPLPADMFSKSKHTGLEQSPDSQLTDSATVSDSSEGWLKKAAEHDSVADLADALPGDDFPEIMPMRKGENRFVVSKKKDRSLTSPQYKRRLAMEQANSSSFVPFVPFPPDYFAKKDKQPEDSPVTVSSPTDSKPVDSKMRSESWSDSSQNSAGTKMNSVYKSPPTNPAPSSAWNGPDASRTNQPNDGWKNSSGPDGWKTSSASNGPDASGSSGNRDDWKNNSTRGVSQPAENPQSSSWKSLEGSAVKETDPLDMSEEAKTERWFRRVAQIKDISELSQIPDEDFPEIMPMRKGVNRFVVSKRKTPLERRLTSPQYRRNLPIVSSEPDKDT